MSQTKAQLLDPKGDVTYSGHITGVGATFSGNLDVTGNVSVGGTLTKQDVTNVDSVGVITARSGIKVTAGGIDCTGITSITGADDTDNFVIDVGGGTQFAVHTDTTDGEVSLRSQDGSGNNYSKYMTFFTQPSGAVAAPRLTITSGGGLKYHNADSPTNANSQSQILNHTGGFTFYGSSDSGTHRNIIFGTNNAAAGERVRIKSDGNIGIGENNPTYKTEIKVTDTTAYSAAASNSNQNQLRINNAGLGGVAGLLFSAEPSSGSAGHAGIRVISPSSGSADIIFTARNASAIQEKLRIRYNGALGIAGENYGTSGQVIKSAGTGGSIAWGDATVGVSSAGTSIGNATALNFIGAGNTFAVNGSTIDISIAGGGGGGGSGQFNTGLTNEFYGTASGIGSTVFTAPSTSGKKYLLTSLLATNVASGNTDVNVIGAFDFNGGERSYFGYNIPLPVGMAAELLKQPMVLNPSDKVLLRSTDISRNGVDTIVEYYGTYEMQESVDLVGVGLGSATMNDTSAKTLYTSSGAPSVLQSIRIANITDSGPKPISISITHGSDVIRLVENLIVPKYASVEILDNQKRISSGAIVKVTLDEGSTMGVQLSAKKISAT